MTPLLMKIVNDQLQPKRKRRVQFTNVDNPSEIVKLLNGAHSFECTNIVDLARNLAERVIDDHIDGSMRSAGIVNKKTAFLPAERTWIEYNSPPMRMAFFLIDQGRSNHVARCVWLVGKDDVINVADDNGTLALTTDACPKADVVGR